MHVMGSTGVPRNSERPDSPAEQAEGGRLRWVLDLVRLARPLHSVKAVFFVPLALIDAWPWNVAMAGRIAWAVGAFMLASAAVYVGNDIADRHRDGRHEVKCHRPIASGRIPVPVGYLYCAGLLASLGAVLAFAPVPSWPVLVYLGLNVAYSLVLKHVPLVDLSAVGLGFVLRVVQGYLAVGEPVAHWLLVTVLAVSVLFLLGKRRQELLGAGAAHRPALRGYTVELTGWLMQVTSVFALISGLMYLGTGASLSRDHGQTAMALSAPFALFIVFRYLQIQLTSRNDGDPVRHLLRDRTLQCACALWAVAFSVLFVLGHHPAAP
ncbi:UbiA prenyltransferase family protein [Nonomuraea sp. ATR24]|uniref:UbiA prenyltransferase family protein n=1 Tax=unclassified Nonomuraea TaxID=2593643 RepID=UPI0033C16324